MPQYVWLVVRLSPLEAAWLPDMLMAEVTKLNDAADSRAITTGAAARPEDRVTWQANMGRDTITLRSADRERILRLAEYLMVVSDTADLMVMTAPTAPALPSAQTAPDGPVPRLVFSFLSIRDFDRGVDAMWKHFKLNGAGTVRHEASAQKCFLALAAHTADELTGLREAITAAAPGTVVRVYPGA